MLNWIKRQRLGKSSEHIENIEENDLIRLSDVSLSKNSVTVLKNLSVSIEHRTTGIIGNNGSGKSSFVRLLNGLNTPDKGRIEVFGYDTVIHKSLLPMQVGFIFQNPDHQIIFPTVLEELMFGLEQNGVTEAQARQLSIDILKQNRCEEMADRSIQTLSEGQKQLICILSILVMQPKLLILDEPFSSIDLPTRRRLLNLVLEQAPRLIMVSHDLNILMDFDRLIWMHDGAIKMHDEPAKVVAAYESFVKQTLNKNHDFHLS